VVTINDNVKQVHRRIRGVVCKGGGGAPPSGRKCPFCRRVQFSMMFVPLFMKHLKRHSFIAQNQNFPHKRHSSIAQPKLFFQPKNAFLQLGKTWNLIPRCQATHISTWIFTFFWEAPARSFAPSALAIGGLRPRHVAPFFLRLHHPFQKSWIRPRGSAPEVQQRLDKWNTLY
jgi:hypothetical protein